MHNSVPAAESALMPNGSPQVPSHYCNTNWITVSYIYSVESTLLKHSLQFDLHRNLSLTIYIIMNGNKLLSLHNLYIYRPLQ